jgi:hypothetical protein
MARVADADIHKVDKYTQSVLDAQAKTWGAPLLNHLVYAPSDLQRRPGNVDRDRRIGFDRPGTGLTDQSPRCLNKWL